MQGLKSNITIEQTRKLLLAEFEEHLRDIEKTDVLAKHSASKYQKTELKIEKLQARARLVGLTDDEKRDLQSLMLDFNVGF
jgi:hypothetical protein